MATAKKASKTTSAKKTQPKRDSALPASFYEGKKKGYRPPKGRNGTVMPG